MRLPFRRGPSWRPSQHMDTTAVVALAALLTSPANALKFNPVPSANLDFSSLGQIAVTGDFNGISLYEYEGQVSKPLPTNGSEALLARLPNGALLPLVTADASIRAMCTTEKGIVIAGNFTSLDGTKSTAIALYDPDAGKVTPMEGLEGEVNALLCEPDKNVVYVGGSFRGGNSTNAISWNAKGWSNLPFAGFNGPVNAITQASNGHIIFGGSFTGLGNNSAPSQPNGQVINIQTANISATHSSSTDGFSDPKNIICSAGKDGPGSTWLVEDNVPATWEAWFGFRFTPTKLRLYNTHIDGRGTKEFTVRAFPLNGEMNFTYTDPGTGKNASCSHGCPLSNDPKVPYQDFHFVNPISMQAFQIALSGWYGSGAGLSGVEMYEDDIFSYAISSFNEPTCKGIEFPSTATATGPWKQSPSIQSDSDYLTAKLSGDISAESASVVFVPNINESGNYSVNMYTPGCMPDQTCSSRGRVNVTGTMSAGAVNADFSTTLFQNNYFDKFDQIYFGYIEKTSDSFKPSVTITPLAGQGLEELTIVAQRVGFTLTKSTGGLNGLFDFDPSNTTIDVGSLEDSPINKLGAGFARNSAVKSLATSGDTVFVGGNFTSQDHVNAVAVNSGKGNATNLDGGLNGQIMDMIVEGGKLYAGGDFTATKNGDNKNLSHVAMYDEAANTWSPLGAGVDGTVENVVAMRVNVSSAKIETGIALSGSFSQCKAFNGNAAIPVSGFAIWIPSEKNWYQNLEQPLPVYNGVLSASLTNATNDTDLFAGAMSSAQLGANGAATLGDNGFGSFPFKIQSQQASQASQLSRRETISNDTLRGVITGAFFESDNANITILAGHFAAQSGNGSTVNNLMLIDGKDKGSVSGLGSEVSSQSTFMTVAVQDNLLFAGGKVTGKVGNSPVDGIIAYDLSAKKFVAQPAPLSGGNSTVAAITARPDTTELYVGGSFTKAGALDCPGMCIYNSASEQWSQPASGFQGDVYALMWSSTTSLAVGGDVMANRTTRRFLVSYDAKKEAWSEFPGADTIPGPVEVMTPASSDGSQVWIAGKSTKDGSVYLMKHDGSQWLSSNNTLPASTILRSLQVFQVTKNHDKTDMLSEGQVLMMTGSIMIPGVGVASAAIFNGTHYQPYALTTNSGNAPGTIAKMFTQNNSFFQSGDHHLKLVFIVLIGLAISLALILLMVLAGIMLDRLRKKREGYTPAPTSMVDRGNGIQRIPPRELLESLGQNRPGAAPHV